MGTDGTGDGLPPKPTYNAGANRKHKAAANRGAPPKCRKTSEVPGKPSGDGSDKPESSRAGPKGPPKEKKVVTEVRIAPNDIFFIRLHELLKDFCLYSGIFHFIQVAINGCSSVFGFPFFSRA